MRYLRAAALGLAGGAVFAAAAIGVDLVRAWRSVSVQMASCADYVCDGYAQVGDVRWLVVAFVLGFVAVFTWFVQRRRRVAP